MRIRSTKGANYLARKPPSLEPAKASRCENPLDYSSWRRGDSQRLLLTALPLQDGSSQVQVSWEQLDLKALTLVHYHRTAQDAPCLCNGEPPRGACGK